MTDDEHQQSAAAQSRRMAEARSTEQFMTQAAARAELVADLDALRRAGVMKFKGSGIDVEFFPVAAPIETQSLKPPLAEMCEGGCGHEKWQHDAAGACVEGCDIEQCTKKPETK